MVKASFCITFLLPRAELFQKVKMSEKDLDVAAAESQISVSNKEVVSDAEADSPSWTPEEEKRLVRKSVTHASLLGTYFTYHRAGYRLTGRLARLDFVLLPPLVLAFFALQLDRGNM